MLVITYIKCYPREFRVMTCIVTEKVVPVKNASEKIPVKSENFEPYYIGKYKVFRLERKKGEG